MNISVSILTIPQIKSYEQVIIYHSCEAIANLFSGGQPVHRGVLFHFAPICRNFVDGRKPHRHRRRKRKQLANKLRHFSPPKQEYLYCFLLWQEYIVSFCHWHFLLSILPDRRKNRFSNYNCLSRTKMTGERKTFSAIPDREEAATPARSRMYMVRDRIELSLFRRMPKRRRRDELYA